MEPPTARKSRDPLPSTSRPLALRPRFQQFLLQTLQRTGATNAEALERKSGHELHFCNIAAVSSRDVFAWRTWTLPLHAICASVSEATRAQLSRWASGQGTSHPRDKLGTPKRAALHRKRASTEPARSRASTADRAAQFPLRRRARLGRRDSDLRQPPRATKQPCPSARKKRSTGRASLRKK